MIARFCYTNFLAKPKWQAWLTRGLLWMSLIVADCQGDDSFQESKSKLVASQIQFQEVTAALAQKVALAAAQPIFGEASIEQIDRCLNLEGNAWFYLVTLRLEHRGEASHLKLSSTGDPQELPDYVTAVVSTTRERTPVHLLRPGRPAYLQKSRMLADVASAVLKQPVRSDALFCPDVFQVWVRYCQENSQCVYVNSLDHRTFWPEDIIRFQTPNKDPAQEIRFDPEQPKRIQQKWERLLR